MKKLSLILITFIFFLDVFAQTYKEDINSDNSIDISDVNSIISVICGNSSPTAYTFQTNDNWYFNIENNIVTSYINEVDYSNSVDDYSYTYIPKYLINTSYRKDQPNGICIYWNIPYENQYIVLSRFKDFSLVDDTLFINDNVCNTCLYNLLPGQTYYYKVISNDNVLKQSHFFTNGQVRMMKLNSLFNVRDLGGWVTEDCHKIKYGRIFRGGEINTSINTFNRGLNHNISSEDSIYMHDKMQIRLDMDLRDAWDLYLTDKIVDNNINHTVLGNDVEYYNERVQYIDSLFKKTGKDYNMCWGRAIKKIISVLSNGKNVYIHCVSGADRTGMLAMLLEGLLGVSEADVQKDYELTSMYSARYRTLKYWGANIQFIKNFKGNTFRDKVEAFCKNAGVTQDEIEGFRNIMLE